MTTEIKSLITDFAKEWGADDTIADVIPWFLFWHSLFWISTIASPMLFSTYPTLDGPTKSYWSASMVSTIHAVFIVLWAIQAAPTIDVRGTMSIYTTSPESSELNVIFIGYLMSDTVLALYYNSAWPGWQANLLHHITGMSCWYLMNSGAFGHSISLCAMLTEITTPFVNQRFFFDKASMKSGNLYVVNGLLMTLLWFIFRVLLFGWLGYRLYEMRVSFLTLPNLHLTAACFSYFVGYALQLFWFSKIMKGAIKVLTGPKTKAP